MKYRVILFLTLFLSVTAGFGQHFAPSSAGHILPPAGSLYDYGTAAARWRVFYGTGLDLIGTGVSLKLDCEVFGQLTGLEFFSAGERKWGLVNRSGDSHSFYLYGTGGHEDPVLTLGQDGHVRLNGTAQVFRMHNENPFSNLAPITILAEQSAGAVAGTRPLAKIVTARENNTEENSRSYIEFQTNDNNADTTAWMRLGSSGHLSGTYKPVHTPSTLQSVTAGTALAANAAKLRVQGAGGAVTLTATPHLAAGSDGQTLVIQGADDTNTLTLQSESELTGSGLKLGAASRQLGAGDTLTLTYDSTLGFRLEVSFSNN